MSERQTISVQEVRNLALKIFDRISASGIDKVDIDQPLYWSVFPADAFSIEKPGPVLYDLEDDLTDLRSEVADPDSPVTLGYPWHALHHLAGVCSALAAATLEPSFVGSQPTGAAK
jgi:hypothetical protein